jgi:hypothetical protein
MSRPPPLDAHHVSRRVSLARQPEAEESLLAGEWVRRGVEPETLGHCVLVTAPVSHAGVHWKTETDRLVIWRKPKRLRRSV